VADVAGTDPAAGDHVILRGKILRIDEGVALVEVYRTYPVGGTVAVQCGALDLDETAGDGGVQAEKSDEDRIREATTEAMDHPGRIITR
jgi:hypothetical protein